MISFPLDLKFFMVGVSTLSDPTGKVAFFLGFPSAFKPSVFKWIPQYINLSPKSSLKSSASALTTSSITTGFTSSITGWVFFLK